MSRHRSLNALEIDISEPLGRSPAELFRDAAAKIKAASQPKSNWEKFKDLVKKGAASKTGPVVEQQSQDGPGNFQTAAANIASWIKLARKDGKSDDEIDKIIRQDIKEEAWSAEVNEKVIAAAWALVGGKKATKWYTRKPVLIGGAVAAVGLVGLIVLVKRKKALAGFEGTRRKRKRHKARR